MFRFFALGFLKVLFFHKSKNFFVKLIFVFFHIFLIPTVHKHLSKGSNEQTTVFFKVYSGGQSVCMCVWVFFCFQSKYKIWGEKYSVCYNRQ